MAIVKGMLKVKSGESFERFYPKTSPDMVEGFRAAVRENTPIPLYLSETAYAVNDCAFFDDLPKWAFLRCSVAGTTAAVVPESLNANVSLGQQIVDGTVTWTVCSVGASGSKFNYDSNTNEFFPKSLTELSGADLSADDLTVRDMVSTALGLPERKNSTAYTAGDCVYAAELNNAGICLQCTTAGTSASTVPASITSSLAVGDNVTDGSVIWTVAKLGLPTDPRLRSIVNQAVVADSLLYGTGANTFGITGLSALARTILARTNAADMRSDLGAAASSHSHLISEITDFASEVIDAIGDQTLSALGVRYSITTNGYVCFGDLFGGLILQWNGGTIDKNVATLIAPGDSTYPYGVYRIINGIAFPNYITYSIVTIKNIYDSNNSNLSYQYEGSDYWRRSAGFYPTHPITSGYSFWGFFAGY